MWSIILEDNRFKPHSTGFRKFFLLLFLLFFATIGSTGWRPYVDGIGAGIGMRPAAALDHDLKRIKTRFPGLDHIQPCAGHLKVEHLEHGRARHPRQLHRPARHVVGLVGLPG